MARLAKAYVLGEPFQSHRAAQRMTQAVNIHNKRLREALQALVRAVEADGECQGYDPRNVVDAHTWVAIAMKEADALLSVFEASGGGSKSG